jgi:hypothetical protein
LSSSRCRNSIPKKAGFPRAFGSTISTVSIKISRRQDCRTAAGIYPGSIHLGQSNTALEYSRWSIQTEASSAVLTTGRRSSFARQFQIATLPDFGSPRELWPCGETATTKESLRGEQRRKSDCAHTPSTNEWRASLGWRLAGFFSFENVAALVGAAFCAGTMGQLLGVTVRAL